eukprot:TRINITY_DN5642_c0_g1_i1.p1 TRINITY_DN5642_c0_g1~~TRINITY_DN5642_c0_g1_i1.p1  ORF type:complete len:402 (+),score=84.08 TRINITY_DN5642_c0_g1_i1:382-1587(+)
MCFPVDGNGVGSGNNNRKPNVIAAPPLIKGNNDVKNNNVVSNNTNNVRTIPSSTTNNTTSSNSLTTNAPPPFKTNNAQTIVGVSRNNINNNNQSETNANKSTKSTSSDKKGSELDPQSAINLYFMGEMKRMKEEMKKLNDEMLTMRLQNMKLTSAVEELKPSILNNDSSQWLLPANSGCGMVVFDLRQNPPIVLTANDIFCEMLGYSLEEVLGKPWHKFIYQPYIEQTYTKFIEMNRDSSSSKIVLNQVYVTKGAELFPTIDTHQLFFAGGKPISDLVFVTLPPQTTPQSPVRPNIRDPLLLTGGPAINSVPPTPIVFDQDTQPVTDDNLSPFDENNLGGFNIQSYDDLSNLDLQNPNFDLGNNYHVETATSPPTEFDVFDTVNTEDWLMDPTVDFDSNPK